MISDLNGLLFFKTPFSLHLKPLKKHNALNLENVSIIQTHHPLMMYLSAIVGVCLRDNIALRHI